MIPWILIVMGGLLTVGGGLGLLSMVFLPIKERLEIVYNREYDYILSRMNPGARRQVRMEKARLTRDFVIAFFTGLMMFFSGIYLGFAEKGQGFWFYKKFYPGGDKSQVWDDINEDGQFMSEDGKAYTYYILVSGKEVALRGEPCADMGELKSRLSSIQRENTVVLIDSFAVSSTYHSVEDLLNELGIGYEEARR